MNDGYGRDGMGMGMGIGMGMEMVGDGTINTCIDSCTLGQKLVFQCMLFVNVFKCGIIVFHTNAVT